MPNQLAAKCLMCPAGYYCVGSHLAPVACPAGYYCENGTGWNWKPCPAGTFSNREGLTDVSSKESLISLAKFK